MPDIIIQALTEELQLVLTHLYSPLLTVKTRHGDEPGTSNWKTSKWQTNVGTGPNQEYSTIAIIPAPVKRSLRDATLHHYNQFTITTRLDHEGNFTVDDNIEISHNFAECAITLTGITVLDATGAPGAQFPHEDPRQFFGALTELHSHVVVSAMTSGWPLINTIVPNAPKELVLSTLDRRYLHYCLKEELGYQGAAKIDLGHFEYSRIYEQAEYANDDIVRWPWNPFRCDDQSGQQTPASIVESSNSRTTTLFGSIIRLPGSADS